jgi:beta-phosphoglucomutase family hydrolase
MCPPVQGDAVQPQGDRGSMESTLRDRIRLPESITAGLFDMDGVLTHTAKVHAEAWKEMFDTFLREREGEDAEPFDIATDYVRYVDGRLRQDGVRGFLESRGIELPEGSPDDSPGEATIHGLGNRKNERVVQLIREHGVETFPGSVRFLELARDAGLRCAVVSASKNTPEVLRVTGMEELFEVRVDGNVAQERGLPGKPAPDTFLAAAAELGVPPEACVVFEDATSGVEAGRAGGFGLVVGVNRGDQAEALREHGADIVVNDLSELVAEQ